MWIKKYNEYQIFFPIILFGIIGFHNQSTECCFLDQSCFTPEHYRGRFVSDELYETFTNETKSLCDGVCHHNSTYQLRCCAFEAKVISHRITEKVCRNRHLVVPVIIYGELAKVNEFPFMAALGWRVKDEKTGNSKIVYKCGGTMYDRGYVITAAHCFYHSEDLPVVVRPGGFALNDTDANDVEIEEVIEHPEYEYPFPYNDIAIIRLKTKFYKGVLQPNYEIWRFRTGYRDRMIFRSVIEMQMHMPTAPIDFHFYPLQDGESSPLLMKTDLAIISNLECQLHYEPGVGALINGIVEKQICAADPEKLRDTCQGDSGGPIIKFVGSVAYVVGITSFGISCGTGIPSVYTRISEYIDWIENVTYGTVPI